MTLQDWVENRTTQRHNTIHCYIQTHTDCTCRCCICKSKHIVANTHTHIRLFGKHTHIPTDKLWCMRTKRNIIKSCTRQWKDKVPCYVWDRIHSFCSSEQRNELTGREGRKRGGTIGWRRRSWNAEDSLCYISSVTGSKSWFQFRNTLRNIEIWTVIIWAS